MNSLELFLLGRKLMRLGESAMPAVGLQGQPTTVKLVLFDVYDHPGTTVGEISKRTGLLQSQVSTAVARFREKGVFDTETDSNDRRRTLIYGKRAAVLRGSRLHYEPVEKVIEAEFGSQGADAGELASVLESLAERFIPNALALIRREGTLNE